MKLIVTIPAFNEEKSIGKVIASIPRVIKNIRTVEVLVYDDGSTDNTGEIARRSGADYVFSHHTNRGLGQTFKDALSAALGKGADIIVNTDADNQYDQKEIPLLVAPLLEHKADLVTGDRQVGRLTHMVVAKKYGNMLGSWAIRLLTGAPVIDASSGFRALTRECAQRLSFFSRHTYTHETLIDAYFKGMKIVEIPVTFRVREHGQSRLISRGIWRHIVKSGGVIIRTVLLYRAFDIFTWIGSLFLLVGIGGVTRYLYFALILGKSSGHVQSLVISSVIIAIGSNILLLGFIAELIAYNRRLIEERKL